MLRTFVKSALKRMDVDVKRLSPSSHFGLQVARLLTQNGYECVFDIGANCGQFAMEIREFGYRGVIISVEPLSHAHRILARAAAADPKWHVVPRGALGAAAGTMEINISGTHASSSLLLMNATHERAAPGSGKVGAEQVDILTFDSLFSKHCVCGRKTLVKIDTQGYELEVLRGAVASLPFVDGLLLELSLVKLYDGQPLWSEVIEWLNHHDFDLVGLNQGFVDPTTLRTLQVDGIFLRRSVT